MSIISFGPDSASITVILTYPFPDLPVTEEPDTGSINVVLPATVEAFVK